MSTRTTGTIKLEDGAALLAADAHGLLRGAAQAGALVRAAASEQAEGVLSPLRGMSPRSVVLVAGHGPARHAAALLAQLGTAGAGVPVVRAGLVPRWVGPLDVVVVLADDPGDLELAATVARAGGRGSEVVLVAPAEGPLAVAGGGRALRMPPRVQGPDATALLRFVASGLAVLDELDVLGAPVDLASLADVLDAEAARDHPDRELFASPAKALAARWSGREVVLAGAGPATTLLAEHAGACLLRHAGVSAVAAELADVLVAGGRLDRSAGSGVDPLFHDPEIDGPLEQDPVRVVVLATEDERVAASLRLRALRETELLTAVEPGTPPPGGTLGELLVLAARVEIAAVYLGLRP
ncbi:TobH protein [Rhodococcus antarcticus]|uniref:TobH protein n=1 Tax=Rhodococcus antarcticus TaxID=2987751 RepID=A0ABY6P1M3_9NOCA|nr:TobH protein [Rhodococcus antarcticus]UZJ25552.1 TobH protein [Rhodococcus antarcticus]